MCPQCRNISRLVNLRKYPIGYPFPLQAGSNEGMLLTVKKFEDIKPYMILDKGHLQMDRLTHFILLHWCLQQKANSVLPLYTGYVCGDNGYCLMQHPTIGTLSDLQAHPEFLAHSLPPPSPTAKADIRQPLKQEVVMSIISQLVNTLGSLSEVQFSHGSPSAECVVLDTSAGSLHVKLVCSNKSSMVWNGYHLQTESEFTPRCRRHKGKINDFYYIMVGLMCELPFYESMKFPEIWNLMWPNPEARTVIDGRIKEQHHRHDIKYLSTDQIGKLLEGLNTRLDILPALRDYLNKLI